MADRKGFVARGRLTVAGSQRENTVINKKDKKETLSCSAKNHTSHKNKNKILKGQNTPATSWYLNDPRMSTLRKLES